MNGPPLITDAFDNISEGVYVLDRKGDYVYCNRAFLKMVGATREEVSTFNAFRLIPEGCVSDSVAVLAFEQKRRTSIVNNVVTPKGCRYRQLAVATPIFDGQGEIAYVLVEMIRLDILRKNYEQAILHEDENAVEVPGPDAAGDGEGGALIAESAPMKRLLDMAAQVAVTDATVLLQGETGSGKEVMAGYIHRTSRRADRPLVEINCAALPEALLEAELFGYEKGAFTGALSTGKAGLIETADGGTLFLDEIDSMPLVLQGKLLRVLESRRSKRLGAVREREIDFRLLAASNRDLEACVERGAFRADLYYRLNVVPLKVPPLRDRREDIIPLALYFLDLYCKRYGRMKVFRRQVLDRFQRYDWPGNVRELKNVVERLVVTSASGVLEIGQVPEPLLGGAPPPEKAPEIYPVDWSSVYQYDPEGFSLKGYMELCERKLLADVLKKCKSTYQAAKILKTDQSTVVRKKQRYGL
ncbi:sigma 54-interacting transcriptional regulator [uncultured Intestinimonas sp.]|uniref:sigma-54 interaction domain-containing protein n=1 Tax=uncultured Intestinimonas sp. TaxID=1689265 RepID=UPI0025DDCB97|nr:sigma 54-interacting transcriptional regulator [uncultured Intestinimonas sp.]